MSSTGSHKVAAGLAAIAALAVATGGPAASDAAATTAHAHQFLYTSGTLSNSISVLAIGRDARPRPVPASSVDVGAAPFSILVSPNGRHVYASTAVGSNVSGFTVGADGMLRPVPGSPFPAGAPAGNLAFAPDGRHLYVGTTANGGSVMPFAVAPNGRLTAIHEAAHDDRGLGTVPWIAITPNGRHLYVASYLTAQITTLNVARDGTLRRAPGLPLPTGLGPVWPAVTPDGRYLYVANEQSYNVSGYAIGRAGKLHPLRGSPYPAGMFAHGTAITPNGRFVYVPNVGSRTISAFRIRPNGSLSPLPASPYPAGRGGSFPASAVMAPDGHHLYVTDVGTLNTTIATSHVRMYNIGKDGELSAPPMQPVSTGVTFSDGPASSLTPDQGPAASYTTTPRSNSRGVTFDATTSRDPDGRLAHYHWVFGDGTAISSSRSKVRHTYRRAGTYRVTLTVTDDDGCSTRRIFTGLTALCNGHPNARISHKVQVTRSQGAPR